MIKLLLPQMIYYKKKMWLKFDFEEGNVLVINRAFGSAWWSAAASPRCSCLHLLRGS